jgi:hypothetical protein
VKIAECIPADLLNKICLFHAYPFFFPFLFTVLVTRFYTKLPISEISSGKGLLEPLLMEQDFSGISCSVIFFFTPKSTAFPLYENRVLLSLLAIDIG